MCSESHSSKKKKYFLELQKGSELTSTEFSHSIVQARYYEFHWKNSLSHSRHNCNPVKDTFECASRTQEREREKNFNPKVWAS